MGLINSYLTDLIDIISYAVDEWGVTVSSTQTDVKARIENANKILLDVNGKEIQGSSKIILDNSIVVKLTDRIRFKKINGVTVQQDDKLYQVKKIDQAHGFGASHWEVWV
jgi:argonaute-like protein implicated in RNA metabolism and viral defense